MNQTIKTYGVIINLDYSHQPFNECKVIWKKIVQCMRHEGFHIDKRMFLMTTVQGKNTVCDKARLALIAVDNYLEAYNKDSFQYITDFFTIDMSNYEDLRLPRHDMGIVLKEQLRSTIYSHQNEVA